MTITPTVNAQGQQVSNNVDPYLQQQNIPGVTGGINNMIRALMAGNDAYQKQQQAQGGASALSPGSSVPGALGPSSVGGPNGPMPLNPSPPTNPASMTGGLGSSPSMTPPATSMTGTTPVAMDPATQAMMQGSPAPVGGDPVSAALMSPIPGM